MNFESFLPFAILLGLLAVLAVIFLYEWVYRFSERTADDVIPYLRSINLEEMKSFFDPEAEKYLRLNSSPQEFRRAQWKRCHLALQYIGDLAHNARVFQEWGKYERTRSRRMQDSAARRTSLELTIACAQCRICAVAVRARIHYWLIKMAVLPFAAAPTFASLPRLGSVEMLSFYQQIKASAVQLGQAYGESYHQKLGHSI
ncbi:MAG TPA: hypothetical protein VJA94_16425 [Candidatus Angelobacter sp.]